jgi:hypothetical protein
MNYLEVTPEVIVGLGENTVYNQQDSQKIDNLHVELEDWLGDDLMEVHPCFVITESLEEGLSKMSFSGYEIISLELTTNEYFDNNYSTDKKLPVFKRLIISGKAYIDDFGININNQKLVISEKVYKWLKENYSINYLTIGEDEADMFLAEFMLNQKEKYNS